MKFREIISIIVIILAIILTFLNNCSLGRVFETFTSNVPNVPYKDAVDEVLTDLYPELFLEGTEDAEGDRQGFVGKRCSIPSTTMISSFYGPNGQQSRLEPGGWHRGVCSDYSNNNVLDANGDIEERLCGGINKNYKGYDSSCPKKYRVSISGEITTHPGYKNNVCANLTDGTCQEAGDYALTKLNEIKDISNQYTINEKRIIGKQILNCYVSMKENEADSSGDYNNSFLSQIKDDTKTRIDNLIQLRQLYTREITPDSYPGNTGTSGGGTSGGTSGGGTSGGTSGGGTSGGTSGGTGGGGSTQNSGSNNNNVQTSNIDDLNDFILKKRKIKQVCNFIKNSQNINSNGPGVETNRRTTNLFGNICSNTGYNGLPQYTGNNNGGSYTNFENTNPNDEAWHQSSKYPRILKTDPKPYNGIMSLF